MYNAWLDLYIKLPCLVYLEEEGLLGAGAAWEGHRFSPKVSLAFFRFLLHRRLVHVGAPAHQGSEVGGQPSRQARGPSSLRGALPCSRPGQCGEGEGAPQKQGWGRWMTALSALDAGVAPPSPLLSPGAGALVPGQVFPWPPHPPGLPDPHPTPCFGSIPAPAP